MNRIYRVLIADDSPFVCRLLKSYLKDAPDLEVVGIVHRGDDVVPFLRENKPDVVTLDVDMPGRDGLDVLGEIMREAPTPVILVTGVSRKAAATTLKALELGAVDFVVKYTPGVNTDPEQLKFEVVAKVRTAARIRSLRVVRGLTPDRISHVDQREEQDQEAAKVAHETPPESLIVIGASTGGPMALRELLGQLPADFKHAVVVVQHMPANFTKVLASQLDRNLPLSVKEASSGDRLYAGVVYIARGEHHLLITADQRIELQFGPKIGGQRPSIDVAMQSAAQVFGPRSVGVLLSGIGPDGSLGMAAIHEQLGKTFAQDSESCVVASMPEEAVAKGVVDYVGPPNRIGQLLLAM